MVTRKSFPADQRLAFRRGVIGIHSTIILTCVLIKIVLDLHPDRLGNFDADFLDPAFVFLKRTGMLRRIDKDPEVGANTALDFRPEFRIMI